MKPAFIDLHHLPDPLISLLPCTWIRMLDVEHYGCTVF